MNIAMKTMLTVPMLKTGFCKTLLLCLLFSGLLLPASGQVTFNKRQGGSLGEAPQQSDFSSDASVDKVEYLTGTVKVNIPLYTIKVKDITVPISISYSTHGKRVGVEPGPLGEGWTLNAGGQVIRQLNGLPDEAPNGLGHVPLPFSYVSYQPGPCLTFTQQMIDGKADGAWDLFTYNTPSGSGQFFKDGMTFPYDPLTTITTDISNNYAFFIRTKDGLLYNFEVGDQKVFKHRKYYTDSDNPTWIPASTGNAQWDTDSTEYVATWDLFDIISSHSKDTVFFHYAYPNYHPIITSSTEALPLRRTVGTNSSGQPSSISTVYDIDYPIISQTRVRTSLHSVVSRIDFPNGRVTFTYDGAFQLTNMQVQEQLGGNYVTIKQFNFSRNPTNGLFSELDIQDAQGNTLSHWGFAYNGTYLTPITDPDNKAQDFWGFYNGASSNKTLLSLDSNLYLLANGHNPAYLHGTQDKSTFPVNRREELLYYGLVSQGAIDNTPFTRPTSYINFGDRMGHFSYALQGTLSSVTLPTGGTVNYEYEPNKFYQTIVNSYAGGGYVTDKIEEGGGIRIKSITTNDQQGNLVQRKEYKYGMGDPENTPESSWQTGYGFITVPGNVLAVNDTYIAGSTTNIVQNLLLLSHPVNELGLYNGAYVLYETVGEYVYGNGSSANGATFYFYSVGFPQGPWSTSNPYISSTLNAPTFYVNNGISDPSITEIPQKKVVCQYVPQYGYFNPVQVVRNHFTSFHNPNTGLKCYFAGIQAQLSGLQGQVQTWCLYTANPQNDVHCVDLFDYPGLDNEGLMNYVGDSYGVTQNQYFNGKYASFFSDFSVYSNCLRVDNTTVIDYDYPTMTTQTLYSYDNPADLLPHVIKTINSKGDTVIRHIRYPKDYSSMGGSTAISSIPTDPVEQISSVKKPGGTEQVTGAELTTYTTTGANSSVSKVYAWNNGGAMLPFSSFTLFNGTTKDSRYELRTDNQLYDGYGNLNQFSQDGKNTVILWGYDRQFPVAEFDNASFQDVAHTCFESGDKGNWTIPGTLTAGPVYVGNSTPYNLANAGSAGITKSGLSTTKTYIVSYGTSNSSPYSITGTQGTPSAYTLGNYHFFVHHVKGVSSVKVAGSGQIAELSLYPADASMTTATYAPLRGPYSQTDPSGRAKHFNYDGIGRLSTEFDEYIYMRKNYDYKYQVPAQQ